MSCDKTCQVNNKNKKVYIFLYERKKFCSKRTSVKKDDDTTMMRNLFNCYSSKFFSFFFLIGNSLPYIIQINFSRTDILNVTIKNVENNNNNNNNNTRIQ